MEAKNPVEQDLPERIILQRLESVPENYTIHNINLKVAWGIIALKLDKMKEMICQPGSVIGIPARTKMILVNQIDEESAVIMERGT